VPVGPWLRESSGATRDVQFVRTIEQRKPDRRRDRTLTASRRPSPRGTARVPALLADATWYGTLAAVRDLGTRGVPVIVAYDERTAPARWSRYARSVVRCPPTKDAERFLDWLHDFGATHPGCVFCPTSDDAAFLVASRVESLAPLFRLFSPTLDALLAMLDKHRLTASAVRAGLKSPATWSPRDEGELEQLVPELPLPLLMKSRTQALSRMPGKTRVIKRREEIAPAWRAIRGANVHQPAITNIPDVDLPVLQAYHTVSERVYTVDGFVDASGAVTGAAACVKVLQLPRGSGPGVCFEPAPVDCDLLDGLKRLCRETGYRGVFDAEFLIAGDEKLLIDLNPRFYNHMAFEVDRSLALPWLSYLAAIGDEQALRRASAELGGAGAVSGRIYVHRFPAVVQLAVQRVTGRMTPDEVRRWRRWIAQADAVTNPAYIPGDPLPAFADVVQWLRHPRSFLRKAVAA
jgi:D-aspartate ligase